VHYIITTQDLVALIALFADFVNPAVVELYVI